MSIDFIDYGGGVSVAAESGRGWRRAGLAVMTAGLLLACAGGAQAVERKPRDCPPASATATPSARPAPMAPENARFMTLKDVLGLPNRADPALEGSTVAVEGFVLRALPLPRKAVAGCPAAGRKVYRLHLRPHQVKALKGRVSIAKSVVILVSADVLKGHLDSHGRARSLRGKHIYVVGRLGFAESKAKLLHRTQGSRWEVRDVSTLTICTDGHCPYVTQPSPTTDSETESR